MCAVGGGLGICAHLPIRIATENTQCWLPEAGMGFHLDAGMSFFLPKLDEGLGYFLGLTGEKLIGRETVCVYLCARHD